MKVALVHDYLREYGGAERVLEVLHEMFPEAPVFTSYYYPDKMPVQFRSWDIRSGAIQKFPLSRMLQKPYTYLVGMSFEQFDLREYDLIVSSSANFAKGVITHPGQIHINYCHTPTRFLWGLNSQTKRSGLISLITGPLDGMLRQWDYAAAQRVDFFIANSKTTQSRIKRFYSRDSEVIYPPTVPDKSLLFDEETINHVKEKYGLPSEYFLSVCRLFKIKNVEIIVQAFTDKNLPLVVVGTGAELPKLKSIAEKNIFFTGFVPDDDLIALYSGAEGFIAAAEDEDFGMTVVEAQSYGVPVIALRRGGYTESLTEETAVFFDSPNVESLKTAIGEFQNRQFNPEVCIANAKRFSRSTFLSAMQAFVNKVVES